MDEIYLRLQCKAFSHDVCFIGSPSMCVLLWNTKVVGRDTLETWSWNWRFHIHGHVMSINPNSPCLYHILWLIENSMSIFFIHVWHKLINWVHLCSLIMNSFLMLFVTIHKTIFFSSILYVQTISNDIFWFFYRVFRNAIVCFLIISSN
jgi:hypothetical protein